MFVHSDTGCREGVSQEHVGRMEQRSIQWKPMRFDQWLVYKRGSGKLYHRKKEKLGIMRINLE